MIANKLILISIIIFFLISACTSLEESPALQDKEIAVVSSPDTEPTQINSVPPTQTPSKAAPPSPTPTNTPQPATPEPGAAPATPTTEEIIQPLNLTGDSYLRLQFNHLPLDQATQAKLEASQVTLLDYIPESSYYAHVPLEAAATLEELLTVGILEEVTAIPTAAKWEAGLQEKVQNTDPQEPIEVVVQFFQELSQADQQKVETLMEVKAYSFGPVNFAEGTVLAANIEEILQLPFVKKVEEQPVNKLF